MSEVKWIVTNTSMESFYDYVGIYSDKQEAIKTALLIRGRRGLARPILIDEHIYRPLSLDDTQATVRIIIQGNRTTHVDITAIGPYTDFHPAYSHIPKHMSINCSVSKLLYYFKQLSIKEREGGDLYLDVVGINKDMVRDYIDELRLRLMSMDKKEPREILMECMDICQ